MITIAAGWPAKQLRTSASQRTLNQHHLNRNRKFVDSPLEGTGFELPVSRAMQGGSRLARSEFAADSPLEGDGFEPLVPGEIGRVFCPFTGAANCCAGKKLGRTWV